MYSVYAYRLIYHSIIKQFKIEQKLLKIFNLKCSSLHDQKIFFIIMKKLIKQLDKNDITSKKMIDCMDMLN